MSRAGGEFRVWFSGCTCAGTQTQSYDRSKRHVDVEGDEEEIALQEDDKPGTIEERHRQRILRGTIGMEPTACAAAHDFTVATTGNQDKWQDKAGTQGSSNAGGSLQQTGLKKKGAYHAF